MKRSLFKFLSFKQFKTTTLILSFFILFANTTASNAGAKLEIDENKWIKLGAGMRTGFSSTSDASPSGTSPNNNFDVQSIRLYTSGQVHENIGFTFNTEEIGSDGPVDVLDAFVELKINSAINIWMGKMLTPADRIEMNGPYYALTWNQYTQPLFASDQGGNNAGAYGRDDGLTFWGGAEKAQYAIGFFDGLEGFSNQDDEMLMAGRFAYHFLNKEDNPAYLSSSTYYGSLGNVFTLGVAFQSQADGVGTVGTPGDFNGFTFDLLSETVLSNGGVLTLDAEFKDFDADYTVATMPADATAAADCFCLFDGDSQFVSLAYLLPMDSGMGKYQPYVRFVNNNPSDGEKSDLSEVGLNYVISGHNARLNINATSGDAGISGYQGADLDTVFVGFQLQI